MEEWRDIQGYEGLYQVSNYGRVRSLDRVVTQTNNGTLSKHLYRGRILKQNKRPNGYYGVQLSKDGITKPYLIHRIVATEFIPNPDNLPQVNHKDEDKYNNCVDNLEWCDAKYNSNYGTARQKVVDAISKPILQFTLDGDFIKEYSSAAEVQRETNFNKSHVSDAAKGKSFKYSTQKYVNYKQAYGFKWVFKQ